jgi:hypothetical protein
MRDLLSTNSKLEKTVDGHAFTIRGLSFAPANHSGREVCQWRGACADLCVLWFAGRTVTASVRNAAIERTKMFFADRPAFVRQLCAELTLASVKANSAGTQLLVRLNTASDIVWERVAPEVVEHIGALGCQMYDYTKARYSQRADVPSHYHLSHSIHEKTTLEDIEQAIDNGRNVVAVIESKYRANGRTKAFGFVPDYIDFMSKDGKRSRPVWCVDGDQHDARVPAVDGRGKCVVLRAKGSRAKIEQAIDKGFVFMTGDNWTTREKTCQPWKQTSETLRDTGIIEGSRLFVRLSA